MTQEYLIYNTIEISGKYQSLHKEAEVTRMGLQNVKTRMIHVHAFLSETDMETLQHAISIMHKIEHETRLAAIKKRITELYPEPEQPLENPDTERPKEWADYEDDRDFRFDQFRNDYSDVDLEDSDNGPTGHGDDCYSDADSGL